MLLRSPCQHLASLQTAFASLAAINNVSAVNPRAAAGSKFVFREKCYEAFESEQCSGLSSLHCAPEAGTSSTWFGNVVCVLLWCFGLEGAAVR